MQLELLNSTGTRTGVDSTNPLYTTSSFYSHVDVTLSVDTAIYAADDPLADTQVVTSAMRVADAVGALKSIILLDEDDLGIAMDLIFLSSSASLGTENSAPSVTDANARKILGHVNIATGDYIDLGGCRIATKRDLNLVVKPATGTRDIYVAAVTRGGTPTYTASGLKLRLGFEQT